MDVTRRSRSVLAPTMPTAVSRERSSSSERTRACVQGLLACVHVVEHLREVHTSMEYSMSVEGRGCGREMESATPNANTEEAF